MGLVWSLFNPLLTLFTYTFVFSVVFKSRWGPEDTNGSHVTFAIVLFSGMTVYGLFAECVNRAPHLITSNINFVKKVIFPLEILPWVAIGSALFHAAINVGVLLLAEFLVVGQVPWTALLFPIVLLPLVFCTVGLAWFLATTGVYIRDIGQITNVFTMMVLFLAPVFYPRTSLPPRLQELIILNPLTFVVEASRQLLLWGQLPNWTGVLVSYGVSAVFCWLGFWWFQKTRKGIADVL
jgi:lipopolysaccharide transport system permease protein